MKRHRGLLAISVLPALTMLGSLILMNDHNSASRRGMPSVFLLYFALAQLILFSFFIGYLPKTNQFALRLGCLYFFAFLILFMLRMAERYRDWLFGADDVDNVFFRIMLPLLAIAASAGLYLLGYAVPHRKRKKALELDYENDSFR